MKVALYSLNEYEKKLFQIIDHPHEFIYIKDPLSIKSVHHAHGCAGVSCFVSDRIDRELILALVSQGITLIALRGVGIDNIDVPFAQEAGITLVRVPQYSPEAVAEFAVTLLLVLYRKIIPSYMRSLQNNFSLDGLIGQNLYQKTVGVIGVGHIGTAFLKIMHGFGCRLLAVDPLPNSASQALATYVSFDELLKESDIVSLHCSLNKDTYNIMNEHTFAKMKKNATLINTGRGALCNTKDLIQALESGLMRYAGLDVYEHEQDLFFTDHSHDGVQDKLFLKLRSLPNILLTSHQAFFTQEAIESIVKTTINNITSFEHGCMTNHVLTCQSSDRSRTSW